MKHLREIAFEGIDGAGKTTVINKVKSLLEQEGMTVMSAAPFRRAAALLDADPNPMWRDSVQSHIALRAVQTAIHEARTTAVDGGVDVLLWDRHWMTIWCEIENDPCLRLEWRNDFVPVSYLRVSPEVARQRIGDTGEPWATSKELGRYAAMYERFAFQFPHLLHGMYRSDEDVTPEAIARSVVWDMGARR